ncbi:MAG TPA: hypothetical protein VNV87_04070 [Acidimicrobiales bacterium]|nr:hypothetical protein [Acidimicrobiales bacterium]
MGLFKKLSEKRMKDPVEGTVKVVGITTPDPTATQTNYRLDGVISGPGIEPQAVVKHGMMSVSKWPQIGDTLPVTVDRSHPEHFVLHLENIATGHQQAAQRAQAIAAQMRGGQAGDAPVSPSDSHSTTTYTTDGGTVEIRIDGLGGTEPEVHFGGSGLESEYDAEPAPTVVSSADVLARGTPGSATLLGTFPSDQAAEKPDRTMIGLMLNVMVDGRPPYQVTNLYAAPTDKLVKLTPGALLPVKVDPNHADIVAVDWDSV